MEIPTQPGPRQPGRQHHPARRITCTDSYWQLLTVGLWAAPAQNVVMMAPAAESVRFTREQALSFRAALDATIAQLPLPLV